MPASRHGFTPRASHTHQTPSKAEVKDRRGLLELKIPPLSSVVAGITDGLGLSDSRSQQPAQPAPAPAPAPAPQPQPSTPSQQPPVVQPEQPPTNQPPTNQPPANQPPSTNPSSSPAQQPQSSSPGQSNPSASVSRSPSASGTRGPGSSQPEESGTFGTTPGGSNPNSPNAGDGNNLTPGASFVLVPAGENGSPVANVGGIPTQDGGSTTVIRGSQGTRTLVINGSSTTVVGGSPTGGPEDSPDASGQPKSGPNKTVIIAVVAVLVALLLLLLLLFLRRRSRARKSERRNQWWGARKRTSKDYQDAAVVNNRKSARSSFGTDFDHSTHAFDVNFTEGLPALPPMAEIRRTHNEFSSPLPPSSDDSHRRLSDGSVGSRSSRDNMTTFAFPPATADGAKNVRLSGGSLSAGLHLSDDPFGDPRRQSDGFFSASSHTGDLVSEVSCVSSSVHGTFNEEETICRPYTSTMPDELTVTLGVRVKVVKVYDDGWAMVEMVESSASRGLIPLDCLRQPGQDFSAFLQEKRVDTYVSPVNFHQL